jgi:hypothetical protein
MTAVDLTEIKNHVPLALGVDEKLGRKIRHWIELTLAESKIDDI